MAFILESQFGCILNLWLKYSFFETLENITPLSSNFTIGKSDNKFDFLSFVNVQVPSGFSFHCFISSVDLQDYVFLLATQC